MRIPVLLVVPPHDSVRQSAAAVLAQVPPPELSVPNLPTDFEVDRSFAAIPLGSTRRPAAGLSALLPHLSEEFAIRGFVEAESVAQVPTSIGGYPVFSDPTIAAFPADPGCDGAAVGTWADIAQTFDVTKLGLRGFTGAGVAIAIMDGGLNIAYLTTKLGRTPNFSAANSWTPTGGSTSPGTYAEGHGTMCAFDALICAPYATLLDYPILGPPLQPSLLSNALTAYNALKNVLQQSPPAYSSIIVSNSWGVYDPTTDLPKGDPGRYIDNPNHPFNKLVTALSPSFDIVFAAGNCGPSCPDPKCMGDVPPGNPDKTKETIRGANALETVITVGGCTKNGDLVGYSSFGPAITGMFNDKPDIVYYTQFTGSAVYPVDAGTSASCPVFAGVLAAIRSQPTITGTITPPDMLTLIRSNTYQPDGHCKWMNYNGYGIPQSPWTLILYITQGTCEWRVDDLAKRLHQLGQDANYVATLFHAMIVPRGKAQTCMTAAGYTLAETIAAIDSVYGHPTPQQAARATASAPA
jgi:hypothetical protein